MYVFVRSIPSTALADDLNSVSYSSYHISNGDCISGEGGTVFKDKVVTHKCACKLFGGLKCHPPLA